MKLWCPELRSNSLRASAALAVETDRHWSLALERFGWG